jgi:hypothetical protein
MKIKIQSEHLKEMITSSVYWAANETRKNGYSPDMLRDIVTEVMYQLEYYYGKPEKKRKNAQKDS